MVNPNRTYGPKKGRESAGRKFFRIRSEISHPNGGANVSFESGDRNKPAVYSNAYKDRGNIDIFCLDPPVTGGGGSGGGTIRKDVFFSTEPVTDSLTLQVVITQPVRKEYVLAFKAIH